MIEIEKKLLQERGHALQKVLKTFNEQNPNLLHGLSSIEQREYIDLFSVYLGLKPVTAPMATQQVFNPTLLTSLQESLGQEAQECFRICYSYGVPSAWNPTLVETVAEANADVINSTEIKAHVRDTNFSANVADLDQSQDPQDLLVTGLLFGIPRTAVEKMVNIMHTLEDTIQDVWETNGLEDAPSIGQIMFNIGEPINEKSAREVFLVGCQQLVDAGKLDAEIFKDFQTLRPANVPGSQYATFGDLTRLDEGRQTTLWKTTGVQKQVNKLLGIK